MLADKIVAVSVVLAIRGSSLKLFRLHHDHTRTRLAGLSRRLEAAPFFGFGKSHRRRNFVCTRCRCGPQKSDRQLPPQVAAADWPHDCQSVLRKLDPHAHQLFAGRARLGADTIDFSCGWQQLSKGETFIDTAKNIEAMGIDAVVVRHRTPGTPHLLAQNTCVSVINAGDGPHEHPTQGLLDILSIRERRGSLEGLTVALVGDIAHSRTARSNIWGLQKLGAHVIVCGPSTLVSQALGGVGRRSGARPGRDPAALRRARTCCAFNSSGNTTRPFPSVREYALLYAMNRERLARAKHDILILAPGPINRGVEITPEVADGPHSVILEQVTNGLAVRMAVLWLVAGQQCRTNDEMREQQVH